MLMLETTQMWIHLASLLRYFCIYNIQFYDTQRIKSNLFKSYCKWLIFHQMCNYSEAKIAVITLIYAWNWTTNWMKRNTKQRSSHCQLLRWWLQFSRLKLPLEMEKFIVDNSSSDIWKTKQNKTHTKNAHREIEKET